MKKLFAIILCAAAVFLTACGNSADESKAETTTTEAAVARFVCAATMIRCRLLLSLHRFRQMSEPSLKFTLQKMTHIHMWLKITMNTC